MQVQARPEQVAGAALLQLSQAYKEPRTLLQCEKCHPQPLTGMGMVSGQTEDSPQRCQARLPEPGALLGG